MLNHPTSFPNRAGDLFPLARVAARLGLLTGALIAGAADSTVVLQVQRGPSPAGPWTAAAEVKVTAPAAAEFYRVSVASVTTPSVPEGFVWIPAGGFTMGSPDTETSRRAAEGPQTVVRVSQGFWMSSLETTQREWTSVMDSNGSSVIDPDLPVDSVGWEEAMEYCVRLTARERAAGRLPGGYVYRLPTEAEWEYACRAGTTTASYLGNSLSSADANFDGSQPYGTGAVGDSIGHTVRGGRYPANPWGLHDMLGNVWEWCMDWHPSKLSGGRVTDPVGAGLAKQRALRGGSWQNDGAVCRASYRYLIGPVFRTFASGLRPVIAREL